MLKYQVTRLVLKAPRSTFVCVPFCSLISPNSSFFSLSLSSSLECARLLSTISPPPPLPQDSVRQRQVQMLSLTGQLRSKVDTLRKELESRRRGTGTSSMLGGGIGGKEAAATTTTTTASTGNLNIYHHQLEQQLDRASGQQQQQQQQQQQHNAATVITTKYEPVNI